MRLAFLGTPDFAAVILDALVAAGHDIAAVYCQPARPAGRGQADRPCAVEARAGRYGLALRTPRTLRDPAEQAAFAALGLDSAVVAAYGLILPPAILDAPVHGCLNVHASLLPRWRGAAPIQRALLAGDRETGITIMRMDQGLDTGAMLHREAVPIDATTDAGALHDLLAALGARLIVDSLAALVAGRVVATPQPADGVTYAAKIDKAELRIDWALPASAIMRRIRAFAPSPGAWSELRGERIKLLDATEAAGSGAPGTVLDDAPTIAAGSGAIRALTLQRAGKGPLAAAEFQRGFGIAPGERFA